ncbi:MAG: DUF2155 domain-containing protein [Alphaproteobacteria bacterium]|nr:DUF2155 domain-containing protein [Alphaproteobacteria bacterium]
MAKIIMKKNSFFAFCFTILFAISTRIDAQKINSSLSNPDTKSESITQLNTPNLEEDDNNDTSRFGNYAIVQALNKTTAKTSILELKVGEKFIFGSIKIIPHRCWQSPLDQKPENKILLEIFESKTDSDDKIVEKRIFYGWMFSSSPSVSGLEHPIYDIIALNCKFK